MKKRKLFKLMVAGYVCLQLQVAAHAQTEPDSLKYIKELFRVEEAYSDTTHLSFDITYYYEELDSPSNILDTMTGVYKISAEKYYINMDSVEIVQNDQYRVNVYHIDSMMQVGIPSPLYLDLFRANIYDSLFKQLNFYDVKLTDTAAYRKLTFLFNSNATYLSYELLYDTTNFRLSQVKYQVKKSLFITPLSGPIPGQYITVRIVFSHYNTGTFTDSVFSTSRFFKKQNGTLTPVSPYNGYELINTIIEE